MNKAGRRCPLCTVANGKSAPRYTSEDCAECHARFCVKHIVWSGGRWLCTRCDRKAQRTVVA